MGASASSPAADAAARQVVDSEQRYRQMAFAAYARYGLGDAFTPIPIWSLASSVNIFGFQLLHEISQQNAAVEDSTVISPVALANVLTALAAGCTEGNPSLDELSELFQLPMACTECIEDLGGVLRHVLGASDKGADLHAPMSVWTPLHVRVDYLRFCQDVLGVDVKKWQPPLQTHMPRSFETNFWMEDRSCKRLTGLVPNEHTHEGSTLASGLYFRGHWARGFNPVDSVREQFFSNNLQRGGKQGYQCVMMRMRESLPYAEVWTHDTAGPNTVNDPELAAYAPEGLFCQVLKVPYGRAFEGTQEHLAAVFVLPHPTVSLTRLVQVLGETPYRWRFWTSEMRERKVDVKLPKFIATSSSTDITQAIRSLGLETPFQRSADSILMGMSEDRTCFVDSCFHKATVSVAEHGEVQAPPYNSSAERLMTQSYRILSMPMHINRPFLFCVMEPESGAILSLAKVERPTFSTT